MKGTERKLIQLLLVESKKLIAKIQLVADSSINSIYPENAEAEAKRVLEINI